MPTDASPRRPLRPIVLLFVAAVALSLALARTVATPAADRTAAAADTHGYPRTYHIYGYGPLDELARYDMIVGTSYFDIPGLRSRNPDGIFLLHPGLAVSGVAKSLIHVTAPGEAAAVWPGGTDDQAGGVNLGWIREVDPEWDLLHNADGSLATIGGTIKGWNLAAPSSRGVPIEVAKLVAYAAKRDRIYSRPWDGVHSDNWIYSSIGAGWFYGPRIDSDRNRVADDLTTLKRDWSNGLTLLGNLLRSYLPGKIVGGNGAWYQPYTGSDANGWLKASNYTLIEHMQKFSPATILSTAKTWLGYPDPLGQPRYLAALAYATDRAGTVLNWTQGDINTAAAIQRPDVLRSMRWGLTLAAMTGIYYELIGEWAGNPVVTRWWFDEYDGGEGVRKRGYLGQPLGPYQEIRTAVYRRDFQNGIAINNSSPTTQTINLDCSSCRKIKGTQDPALNNGSTISSVVVPAGDGIIVLRDQPSFPPGDQPSFPPGIGTGTGLRGDYFKNPDLTGLVVSRTDSTVNFNWGTGQPASGVGSNNFSVRWTGQVQPLYSETYRLSTVSDDGVRLWVNSQLLVNHWTDHPPTENSGTITLTAGQKYDIKIEYYEHAGRAVAQLLWSSPTQTKQPIPQSQLYP